MLAMVKKAMLVKTMKFGTTRKRNNNKSSVWIKHNSDSGSVTRHCRCFYYLKFFVFSSSTS